MFKFAVGEKVLDDLTKKEHVILKITVDNNGNEGIWIDSLYLEGGRHPWELSKLESNE